MLESGSAVWSRRFGDASSQRGLSVTLDSIGGIVIGGDFDGTMDLDSISLVNDDGGGAFVAKLDTETVRRSGLHRIAVLEQARSRR